MVTGLTPSCELETSMESDSDTLSFDSPVFDSAFCKLTQYTSSGSLSNISGDDVCDIKNGTKTVNKVLEAQFLMLSIKGQS